jgi:hypothetical protein
MSVTDDPTAAQRFRVIGSGITVFETDRVVEGPLRFLDSPLEVLDFVDSPDAGRTIAVSRGGTTTFMSPALTHGVAGLITLQGAPTSHLGILSREFGIPCLMSVTFTEGAQNARGETIPPDGTVVRLDLAGPTGSVLVVDGNGGSA